jgi:hypothetical protein
MGGVSVQARQALMALAGLMVVSATPVRAEDGFKFSGSSRVRYETIDGQARPGFNSSDALVNFRTILTAQYDSGGLHAVAEIYDSRAYGYRSGTPVSTNEADALEPVQAYLSGDIADPFGADTKITLTAGRMMLNVASRRLVAADDYRNTTNGYTGVIADIHGPDGWKSTLMYMLPQERLPDDPQRMRDTVIRLDKESFDLVLWGGVVSKDNALGSAMAEVTYYRFDERDAASSPTRDRALNTFGARLILEPHVGQFDYEIETFFQTGQISASTAPGAAILPVGASFNHVDVGYTFDDSAKTRLSFEVDRASGDKPGGGYGRFDTLFGMRRADFAPSGLYATVGRANLASPGFRIEATPSKRLDWMATYHALWLDDARDSFSTSSVRDPTGRSGAFAGHQVEGRIRYWLMPALFRLEFDGVLLDKGRFLHDAPNTPKTGDWTTYLSFNATVVF